MARLSSIDPDSEEGMFMIACLIRGGVFSGSDS
jgi:CRISPR-associated protein Csy3